MRATGRRTKTAYEHFPKGLLHGIVRFSARPSTALIRAGHRQRRFQSESEMANNVADVMAQTLAAAGVERIWGVTGDSLNGFNESLHRLGTIRWMHVRHEEAGAFPAGAEAHVTGRLAVCAGSCGPGNLPLINGLFDCHRKRVPVLAVAA